MKARRQDKPSRGAVLTFAQIGKRLGMKGDTVQKIFYRGMRKLKAEIERRRMEAM